MPVTHRFSRTCEDCGIHKLRPSIEDSNIARWLALANPRKVLKRGQYLYRAGEPFRAVYGIRSGSIKTSLVAADGRVQVIGFHIGGDPIGFGSICAGQYASDASALEEAQVCELPFNSLQQFAKEIPRVRSRMLGMMADEIVRSQELILLLGRKTAEQRLAGFLLSLSGRLGGRRGPADQFTLSMSRSDIGSYLGIAEETVCRLLVQFQQTGLIAVRRRQVAVHERNKLSRIGGEFAADLSSR